MLAAYIKKFINKNESVLNSHIYCTSAFTAISTDLQVQCDKCINNVTLTINER